MVQHNFYRNQPGYRWGAPPVLLMVVATFVHRESADILQGDAERSLDYGNPLRAAVQCSTTVA